MVKCRVYLGIALLNPVYNRTVVSQPSRGTSLEPAPDAALGLLAGKQSLKSTASGRVMKIITLTLT